MHELGQQDRNPAASQKVSLQARTSDQPFFGRLAWRKALLSSTPTLQQVCDGVFSWMKGARNDFVLCNEKHGLHKALASWKVCVPQASGTLYAGVATALGVSLENPAFHTLAGELWALPKPMGSEFRDVPQVLSL